jgi:hypothetical protein
MDSGYFEVLYDSIDIDPDEFASQEEYDNYVKQLKERSKKK